MAAFVGDEDELKQAVTSVSISFDTSEIRYYRSGVFTSNHCGNTLKDLRHFALAVGYGIENGVPYWLIKNSWGEDWGEKGYFKVEMGKNMCAYPVVA
ncbi:PREDICTED: thiol protease aleurain-like [Brassica oleracea var. oleracea]|uniref:thiol protease aleurain-like n=1 Tax=Brassica oleracea var. oleracea TaxID=109376 RepID=UPI0006A6C6F9|nr:PREDICTED: thiol protease aleurain-like [Brassica oleracea var. oleracea]